MHADTFRLLFTGTARARRLLVLIFAVAGVLLGLVAMHSVNIASSDSSASSHSHETAKSQHPQSAPLPNGEADLAASPMSMAGAGECTGMCAMECLALGMACAMALLTIALLMGRRSADSWMLLPQHLTAAARPLPRLLLLPPPPSLTALSISRT